MTIETNAHLLELFEKALAEDGVAKEEARATTEALRAQLAEAGLRSPRRVANHLADLLLSAGDRAVLREVLGELVPPQHVQPGFPHNVGNIQATTIKLAVDKAPHELRDSELVELFAKSGRQDEEVARAARMRFEYRRVFVLREDGTVDAALTCQRRAEEDDGDTYEGLYVATVAEALDRSASADPLDGSWLGRGMRARDGVRWPESEEARTFVAFCRRRALGGLSASMTPDRRSALADSLRSFPAGLPSYLEAALVKFREAQRRHDPEVALAQAELRWRQPEPTPESPALADGTRTWHEPTSSLRGRLSRMPADALDAFVLDWWPDVFRRFSSGMSTTARINLLLTIVDREQVAARLGGR